MQISNLLDARIQIIILLIKIFIIGEKDLSFTWSWFLFVHSNFTTTMHTISILLTVLLAVWRYIAIK